MDPSLATAVVTASGTVLVAIIAILTTNKHFTEIGKRIDALGNLLGARIDDLGKRMDRLETRMDHMEQTLGGYVVDVAQIKGKLGL